jgi:tripeptidyl-peptidase-1
LKANGCGYLGRFPASSPYVTSVGATQGVERTAKGVFDGGEVTCSSDNNGKITSGGGFSIYNPQPAFQKEIVDNYLLNVKGTNEDPVVGYNAQGRGYPDIAAAGLDYRIVANKQYYSTSGMYHFDGQNSDAYRQIANDLVS